MIAEEVSSTIFPSKGLVLNENGLAGHLQKHWELKGQLVMVLCSHAKLPHVSPGPTVQPVLVQIPSRS